MTILDWRSLGKDHLYIRSTFSSEGYSILATDLSRLWQEELDKDDIMWRTNKSKLQIDVEDTNNFAILLKHLASSAHTSDIESSESKQGSRLELRVPLKLPKPLPAAEWTFRLELQDAEDFRKQVTIPLFDRIQSQKNNVADLIQLIQDKDHIVERLLDALAKLKVDLSGIFPTLATQNSSRKGSAIIERTEAETRIPALRPFDRRTWQKVARDGKRYTAQAYEDTASDEDANEAEKDQEAAAQMHDAQQSAIEPPIAPPQSIKRKIGGQKPSHPPAQSANVEPALLEIQETPAPIASRPKGIKRTIGGRKAPAPAPAVVHNVPGNNFKKEGAVLLATSAIDEPQETSGNVVAKQDTGEWDLEEAARRADEKRKALQSQLAQGSVPKPKKRKF